MNPENSPDRESESALSPEDERNLQETLHQLKRFFNAFHRSVLSSFYSRGFAIHSPKIDETCYWYDPTPSAGITVQILGQSKDPHSPEGILLELTLDCCLSEYSSGNSDDWFYSLRCKGGLYEWMNSTPRQEESNWIPQMTSKLNMYTAFSGQRSSIDDVLNSEAFNPFWELLLAFRFQPLPKGHHLSPIESLRERLFEQYRFPLGNKKADQEWTN